MPGARRAAPQRSCWTPCSVGRARRIEEIYLGTNEEFLAAHRFYEKHGFAEIPREHLPSKFPVMAVDSKFYVLRVSVPSTGRSRYRGRDAKSYPS